jgi:hypothetical protein
LGVTKQSTRGTERVARRVMRISHILERIISCIGIYLLNHIIYTTRERGKRRRGWTWNEVLKDEARRGGVKTKFIQSASLSPTNVLKTKMNNLSIERKRKKSTLKIDQIRRYSHPSNPSTATRAKIYDTTTPHPLTRTRGPERKIKFSLVFFTTPMNRTRENCASNRGSRHSSSS